MFEPFDSSRSRYASGGIVQTMPGELIDSLWLIIDLDLKGVIPLENLLTFHVKIMTAVLVFIFHKMIAVLGCVSICRIAYNEYLPQTVYAYDDGQRQTILLPSEAS